MEAETLCMVNSDQYFYTSRYTLPGAGMLSVEKLLSCIFKILSGYRTRAIVCDLILLQGLRTIHLLGATLYVTLIIAAPSLLLEAEISCMVNSDQYFSTSGYTLPGAGMLSVEKLLSCIFKILSDYRTRAIIYNLILLQGLRTIHLLGATLYVTLIIEAPSLLLEAEISCMVNSDRYFSTSRYTLPGAGMLSVEKSLSCIVKILSGYHTRAIVYDLILLQGLRTIHLLGATLYVT